MIARQALVASDGSKGSVLLKAFFMGDDIFRPIRRAVKHSLYITGKTVQQVVSRSLRAVTGRYGSLYVHTCQTRYTRHTRLHTVTHGYTQLHTFRAVPHVHTRSRPASSRHVRYARYVRFHRSSSTPQRSRFLSNPSTSRRSTSGCRWPLRPLRDAFRYVFLYALSVYAFRYALRYAFR